MRERKAERKKRGKRKEGRYFLRVRQKMRETKRVKEGEREREKRFLLRKNSRKSVRWSAIPDAP